VIPKLQFGLEKSTGITITVQQHQISNFPEKGSPIMNQHSFRRQPSLGKEQSNGATITAAPTGNQSSAQVNLERYPA